MSYKRSSLRLNMPVGFWHGYIHTCGLFLGLLTPTVTALWLNTAPATAQLTTAQDRSSTQVKAQAQTLFINPTAGDDVNGDGSERSPLKTITKALRQSQLNTIILLAPGTYSASTGEIFPLILKPGVTLQGNPSARGEGIIIQGGGSFLSRTAAEQNVAVVGANQATITGVTITNSNYRGYGLWIESSNPVVIDNTFKGSSHDGVSVNGKSNALIRSNYFYDNKGNGITIYGQSQPEVRDNVFFKTGFGISVIHDAAPKLIGNRITLNKDGVVVEGKAQPILRNNIITNNERDGLVAVSQSLPDLGTASDPGGNIFRDNGQLDIRNKVASKTISAFGNQLSRRTAGKIDLTGRIALATATSVDTNTNQPVQSSVSSSTFPVPSSLNSQSPTKTSTLFRNNSVTWEKTGGVTTNTLGKTETLPPPPVNNHKPLRQNKVVETSLDASNSNTPTRTIEFSQPSEQIVPKPINNKSSLPVLNPNPVARQGENGEIELLPVPSTNIPLGNINRGKSTQNSDFSQSTQPENNYSRPTLQGKRYRVVVDAASSNEESLVRSLTPDAFRTFVRGKKMLQVGLYSDQASAEQMLETFKGKGLRGAIVPMN